jgi:hypothetical protein
MKLFFGYLSVWFLVLLFLAIFKKIKFADGRGQQSIFVLLFFAALIAIPSATIHYVFNDLQFILIVFGVLGLIMMFKNMVMRNRVQAQKMSFMEYADVLWNGNEFDQLFDKMYRSTGYDERAFVTFIDSAAKKKGILLKNDLDGDALYEMYKAAEKGLS